MVLRVDLNSKINREYSLFPSISVCTHGCVGLNGTFFKHATVVSLKCI